MSQAPFTALRQAALETLDAVASAIGEPLELDANDQCGLEFDADVEVVIALAPSDDTLGIHARVASLGSSPSAEVLQRALALNGGRLPLGMALTIEPHSGQLKVLARIPILEIAPAVVVSLLADLVALVPELRAELLPTGADAAPTSSSPQTSLPIALSGALRI